MGITATVVAKVLNEMLALDPAATKELVENRVACNEMIVNHPTVQVFTMFGQPQLGMLGVINGILLQDEGYEVVMAVYQGNSDGELLRFETTNYQLMWPAIVGCDDTDGRLSDG